MVINDLKDQIPLREISRISGISLSGYYYKPVKRHIQRLDPSIKDRMKMSLLKLTKNFSDLVSLIIIEEIIQKGRRN